MIPNLPKAEDRQNFVPSYGDDSDGSVNQSELSEILRQNAEPEPDERFPRYGVSFLLPVAFQSQDGNRYIGDFNPKYTDGPFAGQNKINKSFYPAFTIMPILGGSPLIPFEKPLEFTDEIPKGNFNPSNVPERVEEKRQFRSARECMANAVRFFGEQGFFELSSLLGYRAFTQDVGVGAAMKLFNILLPVSDKSLFAKSRRFKAGVPFTGPFLDEVIEFIQTKSLRRLEGIEMPEDDFLQGRRLYGEILTGAQSAWKQAREILDTTHKQIKDREKNSYDMQDLTHTGALPAVDLYCLAHLDETEADLKQLKASEDRNAELGKQMTGGFADAMKDVIKELRSETAQATPQNTLTLDEVSAMLAQQRETMLAEFRKEFGKAEEEKAEEKPETKTAAKTAKK